MNIFSSLSPFLIKSRGSNFVARDGKRGQCRNGRIDDCEDCMITDVDLIYSAHYAMCGKPFYCASESTHLMHGDDGLRRFIMRDFAVNKDHCLQLVERWHLMRNDFEKAVGIHDAVRAKNFTYKTEYFHGHCSGEGNKYYDHILVEPHFYKNIGLFYGEGM